MQVVLINKFRQREGADIPTPALRIDVRRGIRIDHYELYTIDREKRLVYRELAGGVGAWFGASETRFS